MLGITSGPSDLEWSFRFPGPRFQGQPIVLFKRENDPRIKTVPVNRGDLGHGFQAGLQGAKQPGTSLCLSHVCRELPSMSAQILAELVSHDLSEPISLSEQALAGALPPFALPCPPTPLNIPAGEKRQ